MTVTNGSCFTVKALDGPRNALYGCESNAPLILSSSGFGPNNISDAAQVVQASYVWRGSEILSEVSTSFVAE